MDISKELKEMALDGMFDEDEIEMLMQLEFIDTLGDEMEE